MLDVAKSRPEFFHSMRQSAMVPLLPGPGGFPLCIGTEVVAGIGASGGTPAQVDYSSFVYAKSHVRLHTPIWLIGC